MYMTNTGTRDRDLIARDLCCEVIRGNAGLSVSYGYHIAVYKNE